MNLSAKKRIVRLLLFTTCTFAVLNTAVYFLQEKLIFFPEKLANNHRFAFDPPGEELNLKMPDGTLLNGLLFHADSSKGLIFYLHGNSGSLDGWGRVAEVYTSLHYDVFMPDYRGFGKSEGRISSEAQLHADVQTLYDSMRLRYPENRILVLGYSIGSGLAAKLASANNPRLLILQAPYYSLKDLVHETYPCVPLFMLKYPIRTDLFLPKCRMPVVIFHGTDDEVIYYGSSEKLQRLFKPGDTLIPLRGQAHNGMSDYVEYREAVERALQ